MSEYFSPSTVMQPLIHRWYAVPFVASPHAGALNLANRHVPALRNYLAAPRKHERALADPAMFGKLHSSIPARPVRRGSRRCWPRR